jgi:regulator of replication initiation timing
MSEEQKKAIEAEMHKIETEANLMIIQQLVQSCAALRVENAALRKALAEKEAPPAP